MIICYLNTQFYELLIKFKLTFTVFEQEMMTHHFNRTPVLESSLFHPMMALNFPISTPSSYELLQVFSTFFN